MTNAAAVIGLTFASTDLQESPIGVFLEIVRGIAESPTVRGVDTTVPGLAGRIARARISDTLTIELRGYVAGVGTTESDQRTSFASKRAALRTLFDPTLAPAALVATLEDASTLTVIARALPTAVWQQIVPSMAQVSFELEALGDWT